MTFIVRHLPIIRDYFKSEESTANKGYVKPMFEPSIPKYTVKSVRELNDTLKKIVALAVIILLIFGVFIPVVFPQRDLNERVYTVNNGLTQVPPYLQPYTNQLTLTVIPHFSHPITKFPYYLQTAMYPGIKADENGLMYEFTNFPTWKECEKLSKLFKENIRQNPLEFESIINRPKTAINKRKVSDFQDALYFIEQAVLNSNDFFVSDTNSIVEMIIKTNTFITQHRTTIPGEFRNQISLLIDDNTEISRKSWVEAFYLYGGTSNDLKYLHSLYNKLEIHGTVDKTIKYLSPEELRILKMIGFITCPPVEIKDKISSTAKQIKELAVKIKNQEVDAIAAAAYVHQEITKINPFMHGNGRTARIWMNAMLQLGGYKALVMPNKEKYSEVVIEDRKSPGTFVSYLEEVIEWNNRQVS